MLEPLVECELHRVVRRAGGILPKGHGTEGRVNTGTQCGTEQVEVACPVLIPTPRADVGRLERQIRREGTLHAEVQGPRPFVSPVGIDEALAQYDVLRQEARVGRVLSAERKVKRK